MPQEIMIISREPLMDWERKSLNLAVQAKLNAMHLDATSYTLIPEEAPE